MARQRLIQRRKRMQAARLVAEAQVAGDLMPVFRSMHKSLERFLRKANLRKRISKFEGDAEHRVYTLVKDDMGSDGWYNWKKAVVATIIAALLSVFPDLVGVENDTWESRGFAPVNIDPNELIAAYELRTGHMLGDVADTTMTAIEREIVDWYIGGEPFSVLMGRLDRWFGENRVMSIAEDNVGNFISQMVFQAMLLHGINQWYWDALGENPCTVPVALLGVTYDGCRDLHGRVFKVTDPMPPGAAHNRCKCIPVPII